MNASLKEEYQISTDKSKLNVPLIWQYLSCESYWAKNIPPERVQKALKALFVLAFIQVSNRLVLQG